MAKLSRSISICLLSTILALPFLAGCGGSGGGVAPKATGDPKAAPQRAGRGVEGAGGGAAGAKPLGN